jgi:hypothetical protein
LINETRLNGFKIEDDDILFLEKHGDTVCIPNNKLHFYGAIREGEDFCHIAIRNMYKIDEKMDARKRAENKWQHEMIRAETGSEDPEVIKRISNEISQTIHTAISQKLQNNIK